MEIKLNQLHDLPIVSVKLRNYITQLTIHIKADRQIDRHSLSLMFVFLQPGPSS